MGKGALNRAGNLAGYTLQFCVSTGAGSAVDFPSYIELFKEYARGVLDTWDVFSDSISSIYA